MKKLLMMSAVLVFAILLVAGCSITINGGTYRVSGYVDTYLNVDVWNPATLTIWQGSIPYSVSIFIPAMSGGAQHSSYLLSHVPLGTSLVELEFTSTGSGAVTRYRLNGGAYTSAGLSGSYTGGPGAYNWTVTISGIVIGGDTTIDFDIR